MSKPDETKELALLNKVELRIALADTEPKLENILKVYLAPLLLKLASPHVTVRNKVISICQHINMRIKSPLLQLPVEALVKQFKDPEVGGKFALVRHFDLIYIQQGIWRLAANEQVSLLPLLLSSISKHSENELPPLFHIILEILAQYELPGRGTTEDSALRSCLFGDIKDDIDFLQRWFTKLMFLNFQTFGVDDNKTCRGLLPFEYAFLTIKKKETWQPPGQPVGVKLRDAKYSVLKFLSSGAFTDRERFLPTFVASAHSINEESSVVSLAEEIFKRAVSNVVLNDDINTDLIESLYNYLFFGEETNLPPVRWTFRGKILGLLSRSSIAISPQFADRIPKVADMGLVPYDPAQETQRNEPLADTERDRKKLRSEVFVFLNKVATGASQGTLEIYGPALVEKLQQYIEGERQLIASGKRVGLLTGEDSRGLAFDTMGKLCRRLLKYLVSEPEFDILSFLFSALRASGPAEVRSSVEGALSSLLEGFNSEDLSLSENVMDALAQFLVQVVEKTEERSEDSDLATRVKYQATRFANRALPFYNVQARWMCLVTASELIPEAAEEGKRGLDPYWFRSINPSPSAPSTIGDYADSMEIDKLDSAKKGRDKYAFPDFTELVGFIAKKNLSNMQAEMYSAVTDFCRRVLIMEALRQNSVVEDAKDSFKIEIDLDFFSTKLDSSMRTNDQVRAAVARLLTSYFSGSEKTCIESFFNMVFSGMICGTLRCVEIWVEMSSLAPEKLLSLWVKDTTEVRKFTKTVMDAASTTSKLEKQNLMINALVSLVCHPDCDYQILGSVVDEFLNTGTFNEHKYFAAIVGLSSILGRLKLHGRLQPLIDSEAVKKGIQKTISALTQPIAHRVPTSVEAGLYAIIELSAFGVLSPAHLASAEPETIIESLSRLCSLQRNEPAMLALASFSLVFSESDPDLASFNEKIEAALYKTHESKQLELHFACGEALSIYACGWGSKSLTRRYPWRAPLDVVEKRRNGIVLNALLDRLLTEWCPTTKPSLKKAACVWLLSIVEFSGELEPVKMRLGEIQDAFRVLLVEKDEFVQDVASRGLTMVFDKADKNLQDDLVKKLMVSFTGENKEGTRASDILVDTEAGTSSTYPHIMNLALEIGDPSLTYRFMAITRHDSLWGTKASFGRFGLVNLLSTSAATGGNLDENPKFLSSLYRRKFDPNPNVRKVMNEIWTAFVKDSQTVIDKYFEVILRHLLKKIFDPEWRVREASCAALTELLRASDVDRYGGYLEEIWSAAFKVMDDMKESVRLAAFSLCRALAASIVQVVSIHGGASRKNATVLLQSLMPFLMGVKGVEAEAKEVQLFALDTVVKLVKAAGSALNDYLPDLVEKMLGLLSTTEPSFINYLRLNARNYNITEETIDSARLSGVRDSPIMETVERCLDVADADTMTKLVQRVVKAIKKAVGMPSKVGCSRLIVTMVMRKSLTEQQADSLLKPVQAAMLDRNDTVNTSYAMSAAYLCRIASGEKVLALISFCKELYFDHEEDRERALGGEILRLLSQHAPEKFNIYASEILPLCFVAMNDSNEVVREGFQKTWSLNTGGTGAIKLYLKEIVSLTATHLGSQKWAVKRGSAMALAEAARALTDVSPDQLEILWPILINAVSGKSWDGKEKVLDMFADFVSKNAMELIKKNEKRLAEVRNIMLREAKRNNVVYRSFAVESLGKFVHAFPCVDLFEDVEEIVSNIMGGDGGDEDAMELDKSNGGSSKTIKRTSYINSIITLSQAFRLPTSANNANASFSKILDMIVKLNSLNSAVNPYEIKIAQVNAIAILVNGVFSGNATREREAYLLIDVQPLGTLWDILFEHVKDKGNESLREKAGYGISKLVALLRQGWNARACVEYKTLWEKVKEGVTGIVDGERSWEVKKALEEVERAWE